MSAQGKWRVSELWLCKLIDGRYRATEHDTMDALLDLRDTRAALADAQTALAAKDARIAELEAELDHYEDWCAERHAEGFQRGEEVGLDDAQKKIAAANARADRFEAQLQAARAADSIGLVEGFLKRWRNVERQAVAAGHDYARGNACGKRQAADEILAAIRARLTPAEPTADTGEKEAGL